MKLFDERTLIKTLAALLLAAWGGLFTVEKKAIEKEQGRQGAEISELKRSTWTRREQLDFKRDLVSRLDRLEAKLDKALER